MNNIDINLLHIQQVRVLKAVYREGDKHLKNYYSNMKLFKYPEKRLKCFDTLYYEEALPIIARILREYENNNLNK